MPFAKKPKTLPDPPCERCGRPSIGRWWDHDLCGICGTEWTKRAPQPPAPPKDVEKFSEAHHRCDAAHFRAWTVAFIAEGKRGAA